MEYHTRSQLLHVAQPPLRTDRSGTGLKTPANSPANFKLIPFAVKTTGFHIRQLKYQINRNKDVNLLRIRLIGWSGGVVSTAINLGFP